MKVVKELPEALMERHNYNMSNITNIKVQAWSPVSYYLGVVSPILQKEGLVLGQFLLIFSIHPFDIL